VREKSSDLPRRVLTALVVLPLLVGGLLWSPWTFWPFVALAVGVSMWEMSALVLAGAAPAAGRGTPSVAVLVGLGFLAFQVWPVAVLPALPLLGFMAGLVALTGLWGRPTFASADRHMGALMSGLLLVALPLSLLGLLREKAGVSWVALAFVTTWLGDMGAYFVGRSLGRHKVAPSISPNKTVEGCLGGLVFSTLLAVGLMAWLEPELPLWFVLAVAIPANLLGQLGDLWESALKRRAGVKDSGELLPGYGGMFDKFDSMCFALPWIYGAWSLSGLF